MGVIKLNSAAFACAMSACDQTAADFGERVGGGYEDAIARAAVYAYLAAQEEAGFVEVQGWRPTETAPKDGTEVLGCCPKNYDAEVVWFGSCETLGLSDSEAEKIDEETFWAETWWTNARDGACRLEGDVAPTHWMPKPPAMIAKAT